MAGPKKTHGGARPGAGRPQLHRQPVKVLLTLDQSDLDRLDQWRAKRGLNRSEAVRKLIKRLKV